MDSDTSRTTGSLLLLLSLLLHILLLLFLFIYQNSTSEKHNFEHQGQEFDTQVLDNQPNQQQQQQNDPYDPDHEVMVELISQGVEPNDTLTDEAGELPQPAGIGEEKPPTPDDAQSDEEETLDDQPNVSDEPSPTDAEKIPDTTPEEKAPTKEPIKGADLLESIADTLTGPQAPPREQKPLTPKQAAKKIIRKMVNRPTITPAQAQTLSKLAQGFMQSMNAELGNKPSNDPTQLAHQRYMTKLWNNLKQTMNAENNVLALSDNIDTQATLVLTIDKKGKLLNALLRHPRKTSDINKMESMLLSNAHKVGLFPPLPESFKKDQVTFVMPIHLRAQQGIHSGYRLQVEQ
jgi:hypothetical protein